MFESTNIGLGSQRPCSHPLRDTQNARSSGSSPPVWLAREALSTPLETYVLVGHVPVGSFPIGHHLPHDDTIAPDVTGRGELPVLDGFWGRPADGDLPTLGNRMRRVNGWEAYAHALCSQSSPPCALCCTITRSILLFPRLTLLLWTSRHLHMPFPLHEVPFPTLPSGNFPLILEVPLQIFP